MTPPMNPHQKPQEDVAGLIERLQRAITLGERTGNIGNSPTNIYRLAQDAQAALSQAYEAGRRDMREAAGEPLDYIDLFRIIRRAGRKDAAKAEAVHDAYTAAMLSFVPTEPLGGEG